MLQVLSDPTFLRGFATVVLIAVLAFLICGGLGVAVGKLIQLSELLSRSATRFLRLGMWLPFFVFWPLPIWGPGKTKDSDIVEWVSTVANGVIAAGPTVFLASCYYHLTYRSLLKAENRRFRFQVARSIFLLALLISLLWQLFLPSNWPWKWLLSERVTAISFAAFILVATVVILTNLLSRWSPDIDLQSRPPILANQLERTDSRSLLGAIIIWVLCLFFWHLSEHAWKTVFLIEGPVEIGNAIQRLLIRGTPAVDKSAVTIWPDIKLSLLEISGGITVSGFGGFLIAQTFSKTLCSSSPGDYPR